MSKEEQELPVGTEVILSLKGRTAVRYHEEEVIRLLPLTTSPRLDDCPITDKNGWISSFVSPIPLYGIVNSGAAEDAIGEVDGLVTACATYKYIIGRYAFQRGNRFFQLLLMGIAI